MNEKDDLENLAKTKKQIDKAVKIYEYALSVAIKIVDDNLPYQKQIEKAIFPNEKHKRIIEREDVIKEVLGTLLQLCTYIQP